ncbi:kinase-like domain-containing protein [Aspergillus granulosus]|uniref:Kinase-like domain-containing protein n=1 Tax=Aspergillus granulosus TaxID=176169 RepID=A0ABR4H7V2_9EURO
MPTFTNPFADRVVKHKDSPSTLTPPPHDPLTPTLLRVGHGLPNEPGRRHSVATVTSIKSNPGQPHNHFDLPRRSSSVWDKMSEYVARRNSNPQVTESPLQEWERWAAEGRNPTDQPIEGSKMAALTRKYGSICEVAGLGAHSITLVSHKYQYCPPLDNYYALKIVRRPSDQLAPEHQERVTAEFTIASTLHHRHVIPVYELLSLGSAKNTDLLGISMEYCAGGDLHSLIAASSTHTLRAEQADCLFKQLLRGLTYLHETGVAHRALAPENLLLTNRGCLKIADFGHATSFRSSGEKGQDRVAMSKGKCGSSPPYISPEQYTDAEFDPRHVDVWAAAVIYVAMRTGRNLWGEATEKDTGFAQYVAERGAGKPNPALEGICNDLSRDILYAMLSIDPASRPTAADILSSPWVEGVDCCIPPPTL